MGIMAVGTDHFPFPDRVTRWPVDLGTLFLMTHEADLCLRDPVSDFVLIGMDLMTGGTRDVAVCMGTARPVYSLPALMAGQADLIPVFYGISRVFPKRAVGCFFRPIDMPATRTVATCTSRRTMISTRAMLCFADRQYRIIAALVMTVCACPITFKDNILSLFIVIIALKCMCIQRDHGHKKQDEYPDR